MIKEIKTHKSYQDRL